MKKDKYKLYLDAFIKATNNYKEAVKTDEEVSLYLKKSVFYGVKIVNSKEKPETLTPEIADENFLLGSSIKGLIGLLTPKEFENLFPIGKIYNGDKWETKDYFYTRKYIDSLDPYKSIGDENVLKLLLDYVNLDITLFAINLMGFVSDLRQIQGYPSLIEEWASMNGVQTHTLYEDNKGSSFIVEEGKTLKVKDTKPKYLKLIK